MSNRDRDSSRARRMKAHRTPEGGVKPPVPSYTDEGGVSDLGVDEPVLPEADEDESPPTGMYAGETAASAAAEDAARDRLEKRFPSTRGDWKDAGAVPEDDADA